jgi:hypothetical protein
MRAAASGVKGDSCGEKGDGDGEENFLLLRVGRDIEKIIPESLGEHDADAVLIALARIGAAE